jgi:superfamily II DNA or RNA helicase
VKRLVLETPTRLRLEGFEADRKSIEDTLTYTNKAVQFELARLKKNPYYVNQHGEEKYAEELARLKAEMRVCLLREDRQGLWTYPGLQKRLYARFGGQNANRVVYPDPGLLPWAKVPDGKDRYYQERMLQNLLAVKHGAVEVGTGLGKSRVIRNLCKELGGLKTLVVAPSKSIAKQLYKDFIQHFGRARVGFYGDGKKDATKLITVGLFQSLSRIEPTAKDWHEFAKTQVFIVDESHLTPASTLKQVCDGLAANAPYRFFFSGTQMRNDGADLLLEGIIGPVVYEMTVKQGVDEGFLSKPNFLMVEMWSPSQYVSKNPDYMLDKHFYSNKAMYARAADIANKSAQLLGHQVLILIDEVTQFQHLEPLLRTKLGFAHGGVTKTNKATVPAAYHSSDPEALVDQLNAGELPILVGTSCISIGTDIRTPKTVINLQGGTSEVKIRQAIGRGTRKTESKSEFNYWDFCVKVRGPDGGEFESITQRHALVRAAIYQDVYPSFRVVQ